jgi:D-amino-acid dehydrogenase
MMTSVTQAPSLVWKGLLEQVIDKLLSGRGIWPAVPAILVLTIVAVIPFVILLSLGFSDIKVARGAIVSQTFSLAHLTNTLTDPLYWTTFQRSLTLAINTTALCLLFGYPVAYSTQNAFNSDSWAWELRKSLGLEFDVIGGDEFSESDPLYHGKFCKVVRNKNHGRINDPGAYLKALFAEFISLGGQFEQAKVISLRQSNGSLSAVQFSNGEMTADNFVFTLGPWSGDIARSLGLNVPFESEGGYHIELINPSEMPLETVKVAAGKFVVTPMQSRIRLAGIVDFSGLSGPDNNTAIELLKISAKELFPSIRYERMETWHGHRPTTANSLPLIGKLQTFPNAFVGFGHQHVVLTGGAKTGRILANLVTGEETCIDLSAFDPNTYNCSQI